MDQPNSRSASTSNRRRAERRSCEEQVRIQIDTPCLEGESANLSQSGILFFTEGELKVSVEIDGPEGPQTFTGSLVRCERVKGERRGWAVEFDRD